jgi:integrase
VLSLPPFTVAALRAWKEQTTPADTNALVFTLPDDRSPAPWHVRNAFLRACKKGGLPPIRRHDLRHMAASLMLAEGLPLPAVAAQLGHANTAVTAAVYSHALRGADQRVAQALERALGGGDGAQQNQTME